MSNMRNRFKNKFEKFPLKFNKISPKIIMRKCKLIMEGEGKWKMGASSRQKDEA